MDLKLNWKVEKLAKGESFIASEKGNSMLPLIKSSQDHRLAPITWDKCKIGDIVFCKVSGRYYTHLVKAINERKGCLIGNNRGYINGWTKSVFGIVKEVL